MKQMFRPFRPIGQFLAIASLIVVLAPAFAQKPDSGKFVLNIQDNDIGTYTFKMDAQGSTTYEQSLSIGGQKITAKTQIQAKGGVITSVNYESKPGGKYTLTVAGAKSSASLNGQPPKTMNIKEKLYPFDNFAPHVLSSMLRAYNSAKGGTQKLDALLVNNGIPIKIEVTAKGTKPRKIGGKMVPVSNYTLSIAGGAGKVEIEVYTDSDKRVLGWNVPSQKYKAWREGYKEVAAADEPTDPLLSKPTFEVTVETGVKIPMRDGVKLVADVYRPKEAGGGKFPVILQRTPYGRGKALEAYSYAKRGYIFVAQDVRGKFDSPGVFEPLVNEAQDGFDTVEWCGKQEWSTGKVGMIGGSYLGFVQWAAAREGSDYLKCIVPIVSPPDPFFNIPSAYGALFLYPGLWWAQIVKDKGMNSPQTLTDIKKFYTLPLKNVDKALFGKTIPFFQTWLKNSSNNAYWDKVNFNGRMAQFKPLPALHVSGWFDGDGIGTKRNYAAMTAAGQANQKLIYGAWPHAVNSVTKVGELDFGSNSLKDLDTIYLRWFDHWLKGVDNGIEREPPVEVFLMGRNEWRKFSHWPPAEATAQTWYLHSNGKANTQKGDGSLSIEAPTTEKPDHYTYDPANPYVPHTLKSDIAKKADGTSLDVTPDEQGADMLVYSSAKLESDVIVAGPISLNITASTSAKDTDWYAYVSDVLPNGKSLALVQGIIRARFRKSFEKPELLTPNETAEYEIDLWSLGHVFQKGHRLRVVITSSCFPIYDRNLNTGEDIATATRMVKAKQTLFHEMGKESYLTLHVLPK